MTGISSPDQSIEATTPTARTTPSDLHIPRNRTFTCKSTLPTIHPGVLDNEKKKE